MPRLAAFDGAARRGTALPARVLLADPPWKFRDNLPGKRGAAHKYKCLPLDKLKRFPLPELAGDCLLLMWRVAAMQREALEVMAAWGFEPKSEIIWIKTTRRARPLPPGSAQKLHFGQGRYVRGAHEVCLIGVRGRVKVADMAVRSVFAAPVQEHSRKPERIHEIAEQLVPSGPWVELFGRRVRPGWMVLGDQVGSKPVHADERE